MNRKKFRTNLTWTKMKILKIDFLKNNSLPLRLNPSIISNFTERSSEWLTIRWLSRNRFQKKSREEKKINLPHKNWKFLLLYSQKITSLVMDWEVKLKNFWKLCNERAQWNEHTYIKTNHKIILYKIIIIYTI